MKRGFGSYRLIQKYGYLMLFTSLIVTAVSFWLSTRLEIQTDYFDLLPDDWPSVERLNYVKNEFRGFGQIIPVIETNDIDKGKLFIKDFAKEIEKLPDIEYVEYKKPYDFFIKHKYLYFDTEDLVTIRDRIEEYRTEVKRTFVPVSFLKDDEVFVKEPEFSDISAKYSAITDGEEYYVSSDGRYLAMIIQPLSTSLSLEENKKIIDKIATIEKDLSPSSYDPSVNVGYTGMPKKQIDGREHITKQIKRCLAIGTILIILLLAFYLRNIAAVLLVLITLSAGTTWGYALTYILLGHVNIITGFTITIIMGLAIDYHIHIMNQYLKLRRLGKSIDEAFESVYSVTNKANLIACATTIGAIALLIVSRFKGFSEFAIVSSIGLICNFAVSNTLLGPAIALFERKKILRTPNAV